VEDTIAAIATPPGVGGIGIVRISGPKSRDIARLLFRPATNINDFKTHHLYHGDIVSPETGLVIDEVLISFMIKPHSYTGEDTLEINCHGGSLLLQTVLTEVIRAGARPAEPGEFTRRAFLNNRIDLSQAEAIFDAITAKTEKGLHLAVAQLKGNLSAKIETIRSSIVDVLAGLESSIDFSDEDVGEMDVSYVTENMDAIIHDLEAMLATYGEGKSHRDGISAVITGRPNVGKSSLLNRLLGEKRAIVTPMPGTTRDFIEETLTIKGIPVRLTDTAGIREPENIIEKEGISLVRERLSSADIVLVVIDSSAEITSEDIRIIEDNRSKKLLLAINKSDLSSAFHDEGLQHCLSDKNVPFLRISAKYGDGISELKELIHSLVLAGFADHQSDQIITNIRHKTVIEKTSHLLSRARESVIGDFSPEFAALDLREALDCLGEISGKTTHDDVLDRIFSTFCIGK
jgi:tRNA modification GTPase